jgi:nicotinamidase/pyrazinamidase
MDLAVGKHDAFLVIDVQYDFLPGGALAVPDGDAVIPPINVLARRFTQRGAHVLLTQDWHPPGHVSFASQHPGKVPFESTILPYGEQVLWPDHCVQGTRGAEISRSLEASCAELVIRKGFHRGVDSYSAFREADRETPTGLAGYLRERGFTRIFCAGLATDFCVAWSALDAIADGFETFVVEDACRGIDRDESLAHAWRDMEAAGVRRCRTGDILAAN